MKYLTRDNITLAIAILSFIISSSQWILNAYNKRTKLNITIEQLEKYPQNEQTEYIYTFMIHNLSTAKLSITRMNIQGIDCLIEHHWIGEKYYPKCPETDIPTTERILSADFPINLLPNEGSIHKVIFIAPNSNSLNWEDTVNLKVSTDKRSMMLSLKCPMVENDKLKL